jgi:hypothetical protein
MYRRRPQANHLTSYILLVMPANSAFPHHSSQSLIFSKVETVEAVRRRKGTLSFSDISVPFISVHPTCLHLLLRSYSFPENPVTGRSLMRESPLPSPSHNRQAFRPSTNSILGASCQLIRVAAPSPSVEWQLGQFC